MSKTVLIVGRTFKELSDYLKKQGFNAYYLRDSKYYDAKDANFPDIPVDFFDETELFRAVDEINNNVKIDVAMTLYENYVVASAKIAEHLGIPGMPIEAAEACTDKLLMRQKFAASPEKISPDFTIANSQDDVRDFAENHSFPLIIKPANLSASLLVYKNRTLDELMENFAHALELAPKIYAKFAPHSQPRLLIEEFMEGSVHSVDAYVDKSGNVQILKNIVDCTTGYEVGFDDNFHYSLITPTRLSPDSQEELRHCAELGVKSLGMRSSPAHIEIIMTREGPRLVEIGARNGGYRHKMHCLANGLDLYGTWIKTVLGENIDIMPKKNDSVAFIHLHPYQKGIFREIKNVDSLKRLPSFYDFHTLVNPGDLVGKGSDGFKNSALIILHNPDERQFAEDLDYIRKNVSVVIE